MPLTSRTQRPCSRTALRAARRRRPSGAGADRSVVSSTLGSTILPAITRHHGTGARAGARPCLAPVSPVFREVEGCVHATGDTGVRHGQHEGLSLEALVDEPAHGAPD